MSLRVGFPLGNKECLAIVNACTQNWLKWTRTAAFGAVHRGAIADNYPTI
jgi:hypothetical protein